jgi:hypothetical protein
MTLALGTRLGPYEIVSALGASGMGEEFGRLLVRRRGNGTWPARRMPWESPKRR